VVPIAIGVLFYLCGCLLCGTKAYCSCCRSAAVRRQHCALKQLPILSILVVALLAGLFILFIFIAFSMNVLHNARVRTAKTSGFSILDNIVDTSSTANSTINQIERNVTSLLNNVMAIASNLNQFKTPFTSINTEMTKSNQVLNSMSNTIESFQHFDFGNKFVQELQDIADTVTSGKTFLAELKPQVAAVQVQIENGIASVQRYITKDFSVTVQNQVDSISNQINGVLDNINSIARQYFTPEQRNRYVGWVQTVEDVRFGIFIGFLILTLLAIILAVPGLIPCTNLYVSKGFYVVIEFSNTFLLQNCVLHVDFFSTGVCFYGCTLGSVLAI